MNTARLVKIFSYVVATVLAMKFLNFIGMFDWLLQNIESNVLASILKVAVRIIELL